MIFEIFYVLALRSILFYFEKTYLHFLSLKPDGF